MTSSLTTSSYHTVVEKSFEDVRHLLIGLAHATVILRPTTAPELSVRVQMAGDHAADATRLREQIHLHVRRHEHGVKVEMPPLAPRMLSQWSTYDVSPVDVLVDVPHDTQIDATVVGGVLDAEGLRGRLTLQAKGGVLRGRALLGRLEILAAGSAVHLEELKGPSLALTISGGSLAAERLGTERQHLRLASLRADLSHLSGAGTWVFRNAITAITRLEGPVEGQIHGGELHLSMKREVPLMLRSVSALLDFALARALLSRAHVEGSATVEGLVAAREHTGEAAAPERAITISSTRGSVRCRAL